MRMWIPLDLFWLERTRPGVYPQVVRYALIPVEPIVHRSETGHKRED